MQTVSRASFGGSLLLAGAAGFVDAIGFILSGGLFVSFMSGNSTQAGVEISRGEVQTAAVALSLVAGFVLGVLAGRVLGLLTERVRIGGRILGLGAALFAATGIVVLWPHPGFSLAALAAVMGAMNTLFIVAGRAQVAITYATGTLVSFGIGLADRIVGGHRGGWVRPLLLWASITLGALLGSLAWRAMGALALLVAAGALCVLGLAQIIRAVARADSRSRPVRR
ncbi:YoaK family protein [Leucobacter sp. HNU]|uniref:YoaK family protein n=1 Tax=Leucobacter sp. HNU TaxID=3236805 RepID=UPI003A8006FB